MSDTSAINSISDHQKLVAVNDECGPKPFLHGFLTAHGNFDTRKNQADSYGTITMAEIVKRASQPEAKDKSAAQFIIPSIYHQSDGRAHEVQREHGTYYLSAIDIDNGSPSLGQVIAAVESVYGKVSFIVYSSSSASKTNKKWRALVLIEDGVSGSDYRDFQMAAFALLAEHGIECDPALARPGQPVYLPNVAPKNREDGCAEGKPLFYETKVC